MWQAQILKQKSCYQKVSVRYPVLPWSYQGKITKLYYQIVGRLNITLYMVIFIPAVVDREAVNCWVTIILENHTVKKTQGEWQNGLVKVIVFYLRPF